MLQATCNEVDTHPLLILWLSSQRPQQHFLLRCDRGRFDSVAEQAAMFGTPPVRLRRYPGNLVLPPDKKGTLLLNDVDALSLPDQIGLYDWLGSGATNLRVISIAARLDESSESSRTVTSRRVFGGRSNSRI